MLFGVLGWFLLSTALGIGIAVGVTAFWDNIRNWLNNTAANAVEKVLGYGAREKMHRAVCKIDRVMDVIRNRTIVYNKKNEYDEMFDKVTLEAEAKPYEIDKDVLKEIREKQVMVSEFGYKH